MIKKALAAAVISLGLAVAAAPTAFAVDPPTGPNALTIYWDQTQYFATPLDSSAFAPASDASEVILSPFGTSHPIFCHASSHKRAFECRQNDDTRRAHNLVSFPFLFSKTLWVYNPF